MLAVEGLNVYAGILCHHDLTHTGMRLERPPSNEEALRDKKFGVDASYYIELDEKDREVHWAFYLALPEGMHWKKGDEMGLGSVHSERRQSYEEFISAPYKPLPEDIRQQALTFIWQGPSASKDSDE